MSKETEFSSGLLVSEGASSRLNLASLRVGLRSSETSQGELRAQLIVQPQTVTAEQATDSTPQEIKIEIALSRLQVLLVLEGGEFDFDPGYTVQVDRDAFTMEEQHRKESSMEGRLDGNVEASTPPGTPVIKAKGRVSGGLQTTNKLTQTETTARQNFLVEMDTPPPDADPNRVRRWRIGADGEGGDPERGLPYLRGSSYLDRDNRPLATFHAQERGNRVAVDVALAMRRDDLHVTCVEAGGLVDEDTIKVKTRLAQLALNRAIKSFDSSRIELAIKDDEILIDVKHKETDG